MALIVEVIAVMMVVVFVLAAVAVLATFKQSGTTFKSCILLSLNVLIPAESVHVFFRDMTAQWTYFLRISH